MRTRRSRPVILWGLALTALVGCESAFRGSNALTDTLGQAGTAIAQQLMDQGVLDQYQLDIAGNVDDPGVTIESALVLRGTAKLRGINGRMDTAAGGTGTQLPAGTRAALIESLSGASDSQRVAILEILGWNRVKSPHNPAMDGVSQP